jgi:TPR repeat protein
VAIETNASNHKHEQKWDFASRAFRAGDLPSALALFKDIARHGGAPAFREVANIYEFGGNGVDEDYPLALHWYKRTVDEANDVWGCIGLARMYYLGKGTPVDYEKARFYYELAEDNEHPIALFQLGQMHYLGQGCEANVVKAEGYYSRAARKGHVYSIAILGTICVERGRLIKGIFLKIKAMLLGGIIHFRNTNDMRLKKI